MPGAPCYRRARPAFRPLASAICSRIVPPPGTGRNYNGGIFLKAPCRQPYISRASTISTASARNLKSLYWWIGASFVSYIFLLRPCFQLHKIMKSRIPRPSRRVFKWLHPLPPVTAFLLLSGFFSSSSHSLRPHLTHPALCPPPPLTSPNLNLQSSSSPPSFSFDLPADVAADTKAATKNPGKNLVGP